MKHVRRNTRAISNVLAVLVLVVVIVVSLVVYAWAMGCLTESPNISPGSEMWSQTYGGIEDECSYSLIATSDGGYALAGYTESFGAVGADFWLVKTDSSGNMEWSKTYGGIGMDVAYSLVAASDGGYAIAGETNSFNDGGSDFWLIKTDVSGNVEWNKTYGDIGIESATELVATSDGGYALAGYTTSFGAGDFDFWLVKTDAEGKMEWNQTYGGTSHDKAYSLVETSDGGFAMAGETLSFGAGSYEYWLVKTDVSGNMEWNRTYRGTDDDAAYALVATSDGGYAIAGTIGPVYEKDFWLIKTDELGNMEWNQTYDSTGSDTVGSLRVTSDGGYALAGYASYFDYEEKGKDPDNVDWAPRIYEMFLIKTDADGSMQWNQTYGKTDWDWAYAMVATSDGGYALAGCTASRSGSYPFYVWNHDFYLIKTG